MMTTYENTVVALLVAQLAVLRAIAEKQASPHLQEELSNVVNEALKAAHDAVPTGPF